MNDFIRGKAYVLGDHVDTDQIIPAQHLVYSLTDPEEVLARIAEVGRLGYALIDQEVETGLRSIAVPVLDARGATVAALNTGMAATQDGAETLVRDYLPALQKVQAGLRRVL
mgnify:CR=1 FL=1